MMRGAAGAGGVMRGETMTEEKMVFSPVLAARAEEDLDALQGQEMTAKEAFGFLHGAVQRAFDRGVTEKQVLAALKAHGFKLTAKTLREFMKDARPKGRMNAGRAQSAGRKLNGDGDSGDGAKGSGASGPGEQAQAGT